MRHAARGMRHEAVEEKGPRRLVLQERQVMGAGMGRGGISCSAACRMPYAACCLLSLTTRHQDTKNYGMGGRRIPRILGVFVANQSHGAPGGRALPGEDHGQGCPWHLAGACPCAWSGTRTAREGGENRGFVDSASATAMHSRFRSGAASRADGSGDRSPPHPPVGTRRRSATKCDGDARSTAFPWSILEARASPPPARAGRDPMRGSAFTRRGGGRKTA